MSTIINNAKIQQVNFIQDRKGEFRAIIKVRAGFMTVVDHRSNWKSAIDVFRSFRGGALETIEFKAEGNNTAWLTVFAKKGKKVLIMDNQLFEDMKVGDINDGKYWSNTNLYDYNRYKMVKAESWESFAFKMNAA
jgi:hypothetical protein